MDPKYKPQDFEDKIYTFWERNNYFQAQVDKNKKPFSIILPPPNANADLHLGHAMYVYEDIMIRYHRLLGDQVFWLAGADHAGFETQFVFEKELKKQGKTRFDFSPKELYQAIWDFVMKNRVNMENQLRRLGFALDWSKKRFTLDLEIVEIVKTTFKKLYDQGLVYYSKAVVNYCVSCGTSFSDLEIVYQEKKTKLWYILYPFNLQLPNKGGIVVATTRPETMLGDVAVAVNPKDKRYKKLIGKTVFVPIINKKVKIIADKAVDPNFGTGAVKITPYHDSVDWEIAKRQKIPEEEFKQVIDTQGRITNQAEKEFVGLTTTQAREKILKELKETSLLIKEQDYNHRVGHCYKCQRVIESLPMAQWFIKIKPLAKVAKKLIKERKIKIIPPRFKKTLIWWLDHFHDWNISRQIVWGIQIPAYFCLSCQKWFVSVDEPKSCPFCQSKKIKQTQDTFDTWFSSAQWPFATLMTQGKDFYQYYYPTSVMETGYDILPWWVARMIMIGYFVTKKEPFKTVFLHGLVRDKYGQKMSKSKGNVINPMIMIDRYGADALRLALVFGVKTGSDQSLSEEKIIGMRNFVNKLWNIGRFIYLYQSRLKDQKIKKQKSELVEKLVNEVIKQKKKYFKLMDQFNFSGALKEIYQFVWHRLADFYLERLKDDLQNDNINTLEALKKSYFECLKMLHPFAPFVTETIWQQFNSEEASILKGKL